MLPPPSNLSSIGDGVLPSILKNLLIARKRVKNAIGSIQAKIDSLQTSMVAASTQMGSPINQQITELETTKSILQAKQLAIKTSANSIYGFCGAVSGYLPCIPLAATVASIGRDLLHQTKALIETDFVAAKKVSTRPTVIYGDTDSVMVHFNMSPNIEREASALSTAVTLSKGLVEFVARRFAAPIKLEFEKIYRPFLLLTKKRYAGILQPITAEAQAAAAATAVKQQSKPRDTFMPVDSKGLQTVRRDSCPLLRETYEECLKRILNGVSVSGMSGVESYVRDTIEKLMRGDISMHKLLLSKKLSKIKYKTKTPHSELAKRMAARDPSHAPRIGDRVAYIMVEPPIGTIATTAMDTTVTAAEAVTATAVSKKGKKGGRKSKAVPKLKGSDFAEDPFYALKHNLKINVNWYLEHQFKKPLIQLFTPLMKKPADLFVIRSSASESATTLKVQQRFSAQSPIMQSFVVASDRCVECNAPLQPSTSSTATHPFFAAFASKPKVSSAVPRDLISPPPVSPTAAFFHAFKHRPLSDAPSASSSSSSSSAMTDAVAVPSVVISDVDEKKSIPSSRIRRDHVNIEVFGSPPPPPPQPDSTQSSINSEASIDEFNDPALCKACQPNRSFFITRTQRYLEDARKQSAARE